MHPITKYLVAAILAGATVTVAQTSTDCNPTLKSCPADKALGKAIQYDFTKGAPEDFKVLDGVKPVFTKEGAEFVISGPQQAPTIQSNWFMMFGSYEIKLKVAPGQGIVTSLVLQSNDLDEVDFEWVGGKPDEVQTNYFGQGKTTEYTRGKTHPNPGSQSDFHTYTLDWTADAISWGIDGKEIRKLTPQTAVPGQYPQSPMQLKIGSWTAGDPSTAAGTREWAGGATDYSKAPFKYIVQSVKAVDYSTGKTYSYGDNSGTWQSIKSDGGKINSNGNPNTPVSTGKVEGTAISSVASGSPPTAAPVNALAGNSTSNATVTSGVAQPTGTGQAVNGNGLGGSSVGSASSTGQPKTGGAARVGAGIGAVAFAAAVMVL